MPLLLSLLALAATATLFTLAAATTRLAVSPVRALLPWWR
jgi:hypothetical protein